MSVNQERKNDTYETWDIQTRMSKDSCFPEYAAVLVGNLA